MICNSYLSGPGSIEGKSADIQVLRTRIDALLAMVWTVRLECVK